MSAAETTSTTTTDAPAPWVYRPASGRDAEPYQRGNLAAMTSGARSPRIYGDLARHLAAGLVADRPDLGAYPEAVAAWATAEAQAALLRRHLEEVGPITPEGEPRKASLEWVTRLENAAARHRAVLGLDPRSEAALAKERAEAQVLAVDLAALADRGAAALAARAAAGAPEAPDLAGEVLARHVASAPPSPRRALDHDDDDNDSADSHRDDDHHDHDHDPDPEESR